MKSTQIYKDITSKTIKTFTKTIFCTLFVLLLSCFIKNNNQSSESQDKSRVIKQGYKIATDSHIIFYHRIFNTSSFLIKTDSKHKMELESFIISIPDGISDYIYFESCHIVSREKTYKLKEKTRHIVASSADFFSSDFTAIYEKHAYTLVLNDFVDFIKATFNCFENQVGYMRLATFSIIELTAERIDRLYVNSLRLNKRDCIFFGKENLIIQEKYYRPDNIYTSLN